MAARLVALGIQPPNIDPVGAAQEARTTAINQNGARMQQEAAAFEQVAQMGLGVMGGKLDGQVDPQRFDQMLTLLGDNPIAQKLKDHPELLPVITKGSINVLKAANDQQQFEMEKQKFGLELDKYHQDLTSNNWVDLTDPAERAKHGIAPTDKGLYQVNAGTGELKPLGGKGQTINVGGNNDIGTIPPNYAVTRDADGNVISMHRIAGSPAEQAAADAAAANDVKTNQTQTQADIVTTDIGRALDKIAQDPEWTTEFGALLTGWQPGSDAKSVQSFIDTIRSNASVDKLQKMRESSPTGGALGSVTEKEEAMLADTIGKLDPTMKREDFEYNLKRVFNIYKDIVDGSGNGPRYDLKAKGAPLTGGSSSNVPKNAEETKAVDGKTYYRVGTDWFEAD